MWALSCMCRRSDSCLPEPAPPLDVSGVCFRTWTAMPLALLCMRFSALSEKSPRRMPRLVSLILRAMRLNLLVRLCPQMTAHCNGQLLARG
jgi:hypothetical protein